MLRHRGPCTGSRLEFGSQNALVGRLDDLGAGPQPSLISTKYKCGDERNWSLYAFEHYNPQDVDKYIHSLVQIQKMLNCAVAQ